ncbi:MAG: hypothetical protein KAR57_00825 [Bacteroidales bacterium]|nr:hypothetical protein [Bacteroidales bacterium]
MGIKINPTNFKWGAIVIIVLIFVAYSLITKKGIKKVEFSEFKIEFENQVSGPSTTYTTEEYASTSGGSEYYIQPHGQSAIALSTIDEFLIESGSDDPINRHKEFIANILESRDMNNTYQESDSEGTFLMWITSEISYNCYNYSTLLKRNDGSTQLAFRQACKENNLWSTEISPELVEMVNSSGNGNLGDHSESIIARTKSLEEVMSCLATHRDEIISGSYIPRALINLCFVDGEITSDEFDRAERGDLLLGKQLMMTFAVSRSIAEFGYELYLQEEYIGSKLFFEALILLNPYDSYFHNAVGSSLMSLNRNEEALLRFNMSIQNEEHYVHALLNRAECLILLNRKNEAIDDLNNVIEYDQEDETPSAIRAQWILNTYY